MLNKMIRTATKQDIPQIAELWAALQKESMQTEPRFSTALDAKERILNDLPLWLKSDECCIKVVAQDTKIIGYIAAFIWIPEPLYQQKEEVFIQDLFVEANFRKQGWGSLLLTAVEDWAALLSIDKIRLGALSSNANGIAFWTKHGYQPLITYLQKQTDSNALF
jgi:GNAT superfamily N-acetyltransferase